MSRSYRRRLEDIIKCLDSIAEHTAGKSFLDFTNDGQLYDAVIRNLEIIGEASRHIPSDIRNHFPEIEWNRMIAPRNILVHEYFGIEHETVWDIVRNKLPDLLKKVSVARHDPIWGELNDGGSD